MANRTIKTSTITLACALASVVVGAWLDWHAFLGNPTRPNASAKRAINYDVEAFGEASLVVGPKDSIELTVNGQSDPDVLMNFAGTTTPCDQNVNHVPSCSIADPGTNVQKLFVFDCSAKNGAPYYCPDPGIKQTSTGGGGMDPHSFLVALKIDLLCIFGCDLKNILGSTRVTFPAVTTPGVVPPPVVPPSKVEKTKAPSKVAASAKANSYGYVFCDEKTKGATVRPMNPQLDDNAQASASLAKKTFYWVSNDQFTLGSINPAGLCVSPPSAQNNNGIWVGACVLANVPAGQQYSYTVTDSACSPSDTPPELIMTVP